MDVFEKIALLNEKTMTKKEFILFTNGDKGRETRIKEIKSMWKEIKSNETNTESTRIIDTYTPPEFRNRWLIALTYLPALCFSVS